MELISHDKGASCLVTVNGTRIDASVAIQFKDQMKEITDTGKDRVVLDLSNVEFIDSSGLGAVVAAMKLMGKDRKLDLAGLTPMVEKVFKLTRMDSVFNIFPDTATANI